MGEYLAGGFLVRPACQHVDTSRVMGGRGYKMLNRPHPKHASCDLDASGSAIELALIFDRSRWRKHPRRPSIPKRRNGSQKKKRILA
jgi:hypothetical protein